LEPALKGRQVIQHSVDKINFGLFRMRAIVAVGAHAGGSAMHVKLWSEQNETAMIIRR
jgi:hypothetical protein